MNLRLKVYLVMSVCYMVCGLLMSWQMNNYIECEWPVYLNSAFTALLALGLLIMTFTDICAFLNLCA